MKKYYSNNTIAKHSPEKIIESLDPYITDNRKKRIDDVLNYRLQGIQLAIERPNDINNALACIRSSEALGIAKVHIITPEGAAKTSRGITQGAVYWVDVLYYQTLGEFLNKMKADKLVLAGGSPTARQPLGDVAVDQPLCLIIGNEQQGLSPQALAACQIQYTIPMCGMSESLNLSVSAAISLYDITTRKRQALQQTGDLDATIRQQTQARYYLNSVERRLVDNLLK